MTHINTNHHNNRFYTLLGLFVLGAALSAPGCVLDPQEDGFESELPDEGWGQDSKGESPSPAGGGSDSELPDSELPDSELPDSELPDEDALPKGFWVFEFRTDIQGVENWDSPTLELASGASYTAPIFYTGASNNETVMGRCSVSKVQENGVWKNPWDVAGYNEANVKLSIKTTYVTLMAFQHELRCFNDSGYRIRYRLLASSVRS